MVQVHHDTERALAEMAMQIARFAELESDWDSYGAETISPQAIIAAKDVLQAVIRQTEPIIGEQVLSVWIAPLPSGGIMLEWRGPTADLEIEITADGTLDLLLEERVDDGDAPVERADVSVGEVAALLDRVFSA